MFICLENTIFPYVILIAECFYNCYYTVISHILITFLAKTFKNAGPTCIMSSNMFSSFSIKREYIFNLHWLTKNCCIHAEYKKGKEPKSLVMPPEYKQH